MAYILGAQMNGWRRTSDPNWQSATVNCMYTYNAALDMDHQSIFDIYLNGCKRVKQINFIS